MMSEHVQKRQSQHRGLEESWKYPEYERSIHESCEQDVVSPSALMLDDIMELDKAKQIASAEKRVS